MKCSYFTRNIFFLIALPIIACITPRDAHAFDEHFTASAAAGGEATANNAAASGEGTPGQPITESPAVEMAGLKTLSQVIEQASGKKIVYVGEYHDHMSHHLVELQVVKDLFKKNLRIAVGMEMFQRPFQPVLDEYITVRWRSGSS